jgi:hypothetical protein
VANEQRAPLNYLAGTLSTAAAISDTALVSDAFSALPSDYTTARYLPLVVHDPSTGVFEVVWVTAHTAASTTVTVVRARESTTALAWPSGSHVICAPTIRDTLSTYTLAGLPTDAHTGMRALVTDQGYVTERILGGWAASVGVARASDVGPRRDLATNPASSAGIVVRAGHVSGVTNSSGQVSVTYRTPFPTATLAVTITPAGSSVPLYSTQADTAAGFTAQVWGVSNLSPFTTTVFGSGYSANFSYLAVGY